jgi:hypothetical protein
LLEISLVGLASTHAKIRHQVTKLALNLRIDLFTHFFLSQGLLLFLFFSLPVFLSFFGRFDSLHAL